MTSRSEQAEATRERILSKARGFFAERGFYGVSTGQVSEALGMSKQGVLHHFSTKEKLYGEVLRSVAVELENALPDAEAAGDNSNQIMVDAIVSLVPQSADEIDRSRLLMRELLDNKGRAQEAEIWYLSNFLDRLVSMLRACDGWHAVSDGEARAVIFQWLGAVEYSTISRPTLIGMFGKEGSEEFWEAFSARLSSLVASDIESALAKSGGHCQ